jgi:hypothetical protein
LQRRAHPWLCGSGRAKAGCRSSQIQKGTHHARSSSRFSPGIESNRDHNGPRRLCVQVRARFPSRITMTYLGETSIARFVSAGARRPRAAVSDLVVGIRNGFGVRRGRYLRQRCPTSRAPPRALRTPAMQASQVYPARSYRLGSSCGTSRLCHRAERAGADDLRGGINARHTGTSRLETDGLPTVGWQRWSDWFAH